MIEKSGIYINGTWIKHRDAEKILVENPATEEVFATVTGAGGGDADAAVGAAESALEGWSKTSLDERLHILGQLRVEIEAGRDDFARTISLEVGTPLRISQSVQVGAPLATLDALIELLPDWNREERIRNSLVTRDAVGVVAGICPWNYPLHQAIAKIAPALAAGCTMILKPSELTPLTNCLLTEALARTDLPPGVFNMVIGPGETVGELLVTDPRVDMVSLTGSIGTGKRVAELAAPTVKRLSLELGGKSANVILPDADLATAVKVGVANAFLNSGQTCSAWTRMIVQNDIYQEAIELAADVARGYVVGDPLSPETRIGPLISGQQMKKVISYIDIANKEGGRLIVGGAHRNGHEAPGYFVAPTIFADVDVAMTLAQEEVFGPVLAIMNYDTIDDAVRIANSTRYGLSGAVWSKDVEKALDVARRLRTGQVDVNGGRFNAAAPWGGVKHSGYGRELGTFGIEEFTEPKAIQM